jgi:hypothetical protein
MRYVILFIGVFLNMVYRAFPIILVKKRNCLHNKCLIRFAKLYNNQGTVVKFPAARFVQACFKAVLVRKIKSQVIQKFTFGGNQRAEAPSVKLKRVKDITNLI